MLNLVAEDAILELFNSFFMSATFRPSLAMLTCDMAKKISLPTIILSDGLQHNLMPVR